MTNVDAPMLVLALGGIVDNLRNLFTNNRLGCVAKQRKRYVFTDNIWDIRKNKGNTFFWDVYSVHTDI